jgi:hypothetical protein
MPDVVPPGQAARIIRPTLNGRGIFEKKETINAISGSIKIWEAKPISKALGNRNIFLKLEEVNDKPTPSIIKASMVLNKMSINEYDERPIADI